jgi:hypothetical protein
MGDELMHGTLTDAESSKLAEAEATISAGLQTFYEVGNALLLIRDARLYRQDYPTFEDYCRDKWSMGASRARQLIAAASVVANLESVTTVTPANEAQARELAALAEEEQRTVWAYAVACAPVVDGRPRVTSTLIHRAAYTVGLLKAHGWRGDGIAPGRAYLIDEEFHAQMPAPEPWLFDSMESSMLRLGVINPLDVWDNTIVDGHTRYFIAMRNGLPFEVMPRQFENRDGAITFILESHAHRKNYTSRELKKAYAETGDAGLLPFIRAAEEAEAQETPPS